jgi:hypothetical protein
VNFSKRLLQRPGIDRPPNTRLRRYTGLKINDEWRNKLHIGETQDERFTQNDAVPF